MYYVFCAHVAHGTQACPLGDGRGSRVHVGTEAGVQGKHEDPTILCPPSRLQERYLKPGKTPSLCVSDEKSHYRHPNVAEIRQSMSCHCQQLPMVLFY